MEKEIKEKYEGISLKKFNYVMSIITIIVSVVILASTLMTSSSYNKTHTSTLNYIDWEQTAERLQAGSDYLTDQVRSYVVTGKLKHLDNYFKEVKETRRRDLALELLKENLEGTSAYKYLENALSESNRLMEIEYHAMALTATVYNHDSSLLPDEIKNFKLNESDLSLSTQDRLSKALELVFDDTYHDYKANISSEVNNSIKILGETTEKDLELSFSKLRTLLIIQQLLIVAIVIIIAVEIILTLIQVVHPLVKAIPDIKENKNLEIRGAYEYRYLAQTYNKMHQASLKHKQLLEYEAKHDGLTGLLNRYGFADTISKLDTKNIAMIGIDIDNFKYVNDENGHLTGDKLLIRLSNLIKGMFKPSDIICRMGGDEFIVIMTNVTNNFAQRSIIVDKIQKINLEISIPEDDIPSTSISAGIVFGSGESTIEQIVRKADQALYKAKANGKNTSVFFDEM